MKRTNIGTSVTKTFRRFSGKTFISWLRWMKCIRVYLLSKIIESSSKDLPQIYHRFTNHLPMIYQRFTKNKKIFSILLSKYLPRIYHRFTTNLPMIYQRFTKSTKHLPTAYQNIFSIYQGFTTDLPTHFWG